MLHKFSPSQKVGVEGDPEFVGVITGPLYSPENEFPGKWVVGVSQPGASGLRGQASVEERRLGGRAGPPADTQGGQPRRRRSAQRGGGGERGETTGPPPPPRPPPPPNNLPLGSEPLRIV